MRILQDVRGHSIDTWHFWGAILDLPSPSSMCHLERLENNHLALLIQTLCTTTERWKDLGRASTEVSVSHIHVTKCDTTIKILFIKQLLCAFQGPQHVPALPYHSRKHGKKMKRPDLFTKTGSQCWSRQETEDTKKSSEFEHHIDFLIFHQN